MRLSRADHRRGRGSFERGHAPLLCLVTIKSRGPFSNFLFHFSSSSGFFITEFESTMSTHCFRSSALKSDRQSLATSLTFHLSRFVKPLKFGRSVDVRPTLRNVRCSRCRIFPLDINQFMNVMSEPLYVCAQENFASSPNEEVVCSLNFRDRKFGAWLEFTQQTFLRSQFRGFYDRSRI